MQKLLFLMLILFSGALDLPGDNLNVRQRVSREKRGFFPFFIRIDLSSPAYFFRAKIRTGIIANSFYNKKTKTV